MKGNHLNLLELLTDLMIFWVYAYGTVLIVNGLFEQKSL